MYESDYNSHLSMLFRRLNAKKNTSGEFNYADISFPLSVSLGTEYPSTEDSEINKSPSAILVESCLDGLNIENYNDSIWNSFKGLIETTNLQRDVATIDYICRKFSTPGGLENLLENDKPGGLIAIEQEDENATNFGGRWEVIAAMLLEWAAFGPSQIDDNEMKRDIGKNLKLCYDETSDDFEAGNSSSRLAHLVLDSIGVWQAICRGSVQDFEGKQIDLFDISSIRGNNEKYHSLVMTSELSQNFKPGDRVTISITGAQLRRKEDSNPPFPIFLKSLQVEILNT